MTPTLQKVDPSDLAQVEACAQAVIDANKALISALAAQAVATDAVSAATDTLAQIKETFVFQNETYHMTAIPPVLADLGAGP